MEKKMNKKWLSLIIAVGALAAFIVLGQACASAPQNWKGGEDSKLLEGNTYVMIASYGIPEVFSFLPNGIGSSGKWERTGSDVRIVIGMYFIEGVHNTENNTISGTRTYHNIWNQEFKEELKMFYLGPVGSSIDLSASHFSVKSYGLMTMVNDNFVTMADLTGYDGNNTNIYLPPFKDGLMITNIAEKAFYDKNLTNVFFPTRNIVSIQGQAFANNKLTTLILPDNIVGIGNQAFANNPLISITIGANVNFLVHFGRGDLGGANSSNSSFPIGNNFEKTYIDGGRKAGTYTRPNADSTTWTKQ